MQFELGSTPLKTIKERIDTTFRKSEYIAKHYYYC